MLEAIEKLLILQEADSQLLQLGHELQAVEPQREAFRARAAAAEAGGATAKHRILDLEKERVSLELEAGSKREQLERFLRQQSEIKKNEEYRALLHEIDGIKAEIISVEDRELEVMEQAETAQKEQQESQRAAEALRAEVAKQLSQLDKREFELKARLAELEERRVHLAAQVDGGLLPRYERLRKSKGRRVVVGIEHSVCGGCHVKLPAQIIVYCQAGQQVQSCPNCGRLLYYTPDMDLSAAD
jgi:predicted  nucleic acid-binding Zn-ribbon protein